jgi:hypothetical protein
VVMAVKVLPAPGAIWNSARGRRQVMQTGAQRGRFGQPLAQRFGPGEGENRARTRLGVAA